MSRTSDRLPDPGFLGDLASSFRALRKRPLLPAVSLVVWSAPILLPPSLSLIGLPISIFAIGYPGTERLWFLSALRGENFSWNDAFRRTWPYVGRFLVLSLTVFPVVAVGGLLGWAIGRSLLAVLVGLGAATIVLDGALTFVTPALAFSTSKVRAALSIGLRMISSEWSACALYVVVPPLAILLLAHVVPGLSSIRHIRQQLTAIQNGRPPPPAGELVRVYSWLVAAMATLVALWLKGATVAFYSRRFSISTEPLTARPTPPRPDISSG